jgi:gamma-glutamyl:cysteine ligase YbdK (ATP-grasp superfamily)
LLRNTVELVTGICESVAQAIEDLRESRDVVRRVARQRGLEIFSVGTHPFARWYDQEVSEGERYATLIERTQWWGRHMLIFGVHVHVGVDSAGKVLPILNALLRWFPAPAGAVGLLAVLGRGRHRVRQQPGQLEPVAARLGCPAELASVADIMAAGASYQRQRAVATRAAGYLWAVVDSLVREMRDGLPGSAARRTNHVGGADTP